MPRTCPWQVNGRKLQSDFKLTNSSTQISRRTSSKPRQLYRHVGLVVLIVVFICLVMVFDATITFQDETVSSSSSSSSSSVLSSTAVDDIELLKEEILELSQQYIRVKLMTSYEYADQSRALALSRSLTVEIDQVVERIASVDARRRALKVNNFTNTRQMASLNALLLTSANLLDLRRADITYDVH